MTRALEVQETTGRHSPGSAHRQAGPDVGLMSLHASAGNAAVSAAIQRLQSEPARPTPLSPHSDPRFAALTKQIGSRAGAARAHPKPKAEAAKGQGAAVAPVGDKEAQAKEAQSAEMDAAKPGGFDKAGFIAAVKAAIAAQAPKNLEEADEFGTSGKAENVKTQVAGRVGEGRAAAAGGIAGATTRTPDESRATEKPVTPLRPEPTPAMPPVNAAGGMPQRAPAEQTDFSGGQRETDGAMADADVTEQQLASSNEPDFTGAVAAKKEGEQHSAVAPAQVRAVEQEKLQSSEKGAQSAGGSGLAGLLGAKSGALSKAAAGKTATKTKDEAARLAVTSEIKRLFDATKTEVTGILTALDGAVNEKFTVGEKEARAAFTTQHKTEMEKYKDARYSGISGAAAWVADKLTSLPKEADDIFVRAKKVYEDRMSALISSVADFIGGELTKAKERIARGRAEIKAFVDKQPKDLAKVGKDAAAEFEGQFEQLEGDVDSKKDSLVEDLAAKYVEAKGAVDEEITAAQDENKGLWDKAKDAIGGAIKTIMQLKDMLLGVLARAAASVSKIIKDPIGFLGNFVNAVKAGVQGFLTRIGTHLKEGLKGWLFGALGEAGIEVPEQFDLKGIIKMVLSLLGLTWSSIRARITKQIPEPVMQKIEQTVDVIKILASEGVGGLWKMIAAKLSDLKETVMGKVQDFIESKVITAGITWLISLLNPAAAFIKACKMIYDAVMWFVENAQRMKEFVDSILDSVESIVSGGVGAVAGMIEATMAKTVPMIISGMASLLGLGGIAEKVKGIIQSVQKPVNKVLDGIIGGVVKAAGPLVRAFKKGAGFVKGKIAAGKAFVKDKALKVAEKLGIIRKPVRTKTESHTISYDDRRGVFLMASANEGEIKAKIHARIAAIEAAIGPLPGTVKSKEQAFLALCNDLQAAIKRAPDVGTKTRLAASALDQIGDDLLVALIDETSAKKSKGKTPERLGDVDTYAGLKKRPPVDEPLRRTWAEHVIPGSFFSSYFIARGGSAISNQEYDSIHTVLIYELASKAKDSGKSGDQALIRKYKAEIAKKGKAKSGVDDLGIFQFLASNAVDRVLTSVRADHLVHKAARGEAEPQLPSDTNIIAAYNAAIEDFQRISASRAGASR
ncbi:hypothetical protein [Leifsonia sp. Leaf264]|uniref:hypothetical protein n=1 Tax=Leifsonia sp. Leaf264 TaxID=1736314 RepID=UPI0006F8AB04|nr:hypothetical protein [Leifsonia sp. Leaf264]KQO96743.1 hypothetical protein ASF30_16740 [Leifsonia sp. Leaf264]